ncbi:MAG TPA: DUF3363 domain-containing protein [Polyangiaceae bacterium]|nr:DUF3363 domain-containing protein [Polyangiaceae bacterium]
MVQVGSERGRTAARVHLGYLERDGVEQDGSRGALYGRDGAVDRAAFNEDLPGESRQFRIILSPEDGHQLDLEEYVRRCMAQVEADTGRKLRWAAVNHFNTDNPHAHVVIRGLDSQGEEVRLSPEYVSHGLRHRAEDLATEKLGPRREQDVIEQLQKEVQRERYTSLDRELERRAAGGAFRPSAAGRRRPHFEAALRSRLEVLASLGLAARSGRLDWQLAPELRAELQQMGRRGEGLQAIRSVLRIDTNRCRIIDPNEPNHGGREELARGVQGVLRWKGLDENGRFCAVIETTGGVAYHLPVSGRVATDACVGQIVELKRAVDKDQRIEEMAHKSGWTYDASALPEGSRLAYRQRLEQLERLGLATRDLVAPDRWRLRPDFRAELSQGKPQPLWQMLSVRPEAQSLHQQTTYDGHVWLDRLRVDEVAPAGFGREVQEALEKRHAHLRELGLEPRDEKLRSRLVERQRRRVEQELAARDGPGSASTSERPRVSVAVQPSDGFEGTAHVHAAPNGQQFLAVRSPGRFAVVPVFRDERQREGREVRVHMKQGRVQSIETLGPEREPGGTDRGGFER